MVRNYKRKTVTKYSLDQLVLAVEDVRSKRLTSYRAALKYGIPRSTIMTRLYRRRNLVEAAKQPDRGLQVARKWNHRDEAVLSILDQKPPSVVIGHTSGQTDQFDYELVPETTEPSQSKPSDPLNSRREDAESHVETPELSFREVKMELESDDERSREPDSDGEKSKTELEMELLRIKVYKARLEARQLELSLGLPRSVHTRRLPAPRRRPRLARRARATVVESEGSDDGFS